MKVLSYISALLLLTLVGCSPAPESTDVSKSELTVQKASSVKVADETPLYQTQAFKDYWYAGVAELTGYELKQARYGEIHEGEAVLVYVTEPFSKSKQVKLDYAGRNPEDKVSVLKLNASTKFLTGIYPYSVLTSVFSPVNVQQRPYVLKLSNTVQEWCGHTYLQLNHRDQGYQARLFSYFESEGDQDIQIGNVLTEDELFTRLRLEPNSIPLGEVEVLPSAMYLRFSHRPMTPVKASISWEDTELEGQKARALNVSYGGRKLKIYTEAAFPHAILGWDDNASGLTTTARRLKTLRSPYWSQHNNVHRKLRAELGLKVQ